MALSIEQWHPAVRRRLLACLAGSALLHAVSVALLAGIGSAMFRPPAVAPVLEVKLPAPPPEAGTPPGAERLLKDTLSDGGAGPAAAPPPRARVPGDKHPRGSQAARQRAAQRKLAEHLFYPPQAVAAGIEGEVRLLLTLDPAGNVIDAVIASSSGHPVLDRAAVAAARALGRLPTADERELILPVVFRLE